MYKRLNSIYNGMLDRCLNRNNSNFHNYGGRGIVVCLEWIRNRDAFCRWALANGYAPNLTIDRKDVDDGYHPSNCRWIIPAHQALNKRSTRFVFYHGEWKKLYEWCLLLGLDYKMVYTRMALRGWDAEDAFNPDLNHIPRQHIFQGRVISTLERANLLSIYRKIINESFVFFGPAPQKMTREAKIKELEEQIDESFFFFEIDPEPLERFHKITNAA